MYQKIGPLYPITNHKRIKKVGNFLAEKRFEDGEGKKKEKKKQKS